MSFSFQKERAADGLRRQPADELLFLKEAFLRGPAAQGGMYSLVVFFHEGCKRRAEPFDIPEIPHVERGKKFHPYGKEPSLDLRFGSGREGLTVMDGGSDPCSEELHLLIAETWPVVKAEQPRPAVFCDGRPYDFHEVDEGIVEKGIRGDDEPAGIIDQGDDVQALLSFRGLQVRAVTRIPVPDLVDVGAFIPAHVFSCRPAGIFPAGPDKALHRGGGDLSRADGPVALQGAVHFGRRYLRMLGKEEPGLCLHVLVKHAALPLVFPALRHEAFKSPVPVKAVPFFNG